MATVIYSKPNCIHCTNAKNLLTKMNIPFDEKVLDVDFTREQLFELFPSAKTFPQIIFEDEHIGGFSDLAKRISGW